MPSMRARIIRHCSVLGTDPISGAACAGLIRVNVTRTEVVPSFILNGRRQNLTKSIICEQPNGKRLLALANIVPIRNNDDEVIGAVNIFRHNTSKTVPGLHTN